LVDEELADQVWEAWDTGEIDDQVVWLAWWLIVERPLSRPALVWWTNGQLFLFVVYWTVGTLRVENKFALPCRRTFE